MYLVKRWTVSSIFRTHLITILEALITTSQQSASNKTKWREESIILNHRLCHKFTFQPFIILFA